MDINIQLDAGNVTGGADSALRTLEKIKSLIDSTEPITSKLSKNSRLDFSQQLQALRNLTQQAETTSQKLQKALDSGSKGWATRFRNQLSAGLGEVQAALEKLSNVKLRGPDSKAMAASLKDAKRQVVDLETTIQRLEPF